MNSEHISTLVKEGKMKQYFRTSNFGGTCFSDAIANELFEKNVTEFANFAYTDYGALHGSGILDYAVIRYVRENYKSEDGCIIEPTAYFGKNMVLYGAALQWLFEDLSLDKEEIGKCGELSALCFALEDVLVEYEREAAEKEAKEIIKENPEKGLNEVALAWAIQDADSGLNTNGTPDYSDNDLWSCYEKCLEQL